MKIVMGHGPERRMDRRSAWNDDLKSLVGAVVTTLLCSNFAIAGGQSVVRDNGLSTAVIEPSRLIVAGTYVFEGGWGDLKIEQSNQQETLSFSIETMGANAHQCGLSGVIRKGEAVLVDEKSGERCRLLFRTRRDSGLDVLATDLREGGCREYCGTRAFFAGTYFRPAENCSNGWNSSENELVWRSRLRMTCWT